MFWKFLNKSAATTGEPQTEKKPSGTEIKLPLTYLHKLIPIGDLPADELQALPVTVYHFNPGEIIFNRGDSADALLYLQSGEVFLEAANGSGYSVEDSVFKACYPLSNHSEHQFTAIARKPTSVVYVPSLALQRSSGAAMNNNPLVNSKDLPNGLRECALFQGFCEAYRKDDLHVPSLPDVALRLRSAMQKDISIADAVKIINLDPLIASKLIQVANSPLYRTANPIASCHDAVNRLGFKTTQNLVTSISLHNLFRSKSKRLNDYIQQLWKQSIQVASLSHTLAALTRKINADEAMLAGLTHNIGALPIVSFAESLDSAMYSDEQLTETISVLQGRVGEHILKKWHFPDNLLKIPSETTYWYHNETPELQLSDIVLLARFHSQLGQAKTQTLPPLNTLPAFAKLGDHALTPDMSLQILQDAKQQIAEALSFFRT